MYSQATTRDGAILRKQLCSSFLESVVDGTGAVSAHGKGRLSVVEDYSFGTIFDRLVD